MHNGFVKPSNKNNLSHKKYSFQEKFSIVHIIVQLTGSLIDSF